MKADESLKHRDAIRSARGGRHSWEPQEAPGGPSARILRDSDLMCEVPGEVPGWATWSHFRSLQIDSDYCRGPAGTMEDHFDCLNNVWIVAIKEHSLIHTVLKMVTSKDLGIDFMNRFFRNWIWQQTGRMLLPRKEDAKVRARCSWEFEDPFLEFLLGTIYREIRCFFFPLSWATLGLRSGDAEVRVCCDLVIGLVD